MMEAEADSRGFFEAQKRAFVGDGLHYNWTIQQRHFPTFTPVLDFTHVIERVYETARAVREDSKQAWRIYIRWTRWCWEGKGIEMLEEMRQEQRRLGDPPKDCEDNDPRKVLAENVTYFQNNASRMHYPRYRKEGLPITSAHMESLVKEINYRVKGTEKFWNDGPAGEAILQIRAAALSEDNRLKKHLLSRPGNPYHPNAKVQPRPATAA